MSRFHRQSAEEIRRCSAPEQAHGRKSHHHSQKRHFVRCPSHTHLPDTAQRSVRPWQPPCHFKDLQSASIQLLTGCLVVALHGPRQPNPSAVVDSLPVEPCFLSPFCPSNGWSSCLPPTRPRLWCHP